MGQGRLSACVPWCCNACVNCDHAPAWKNAACPAELHTTVKVTPAADQVVLRAPRLVVEVGTKRRRWGGICATCCTSGCAFLLPPIWLTRSVGITRTVHTGAGLPVAELMLQCNALSIAAGS